MTIVNCNTKTCSVCGVEKPLSDYYIWTSNKKYMAQCKKCHQTRSKKYSPLPADRCGNEHQNALIDILRSRGIYASPGKSSEYAYSDVVAWGCVRIEVKFGESLGSSNPSIWKFRFTERQTNGGLVADLIALMCPAGSGKGYTCYLIDPSCPELYRGGRFRPTFTINLGTHRKNRTDGRLPLSSELLNTHRDNWQVIEQKRLEIAERYQRRELKPVV